MLLPLPIHEVMVLLLLCFVIGPAPLHGLVIRGLLVPSLAKASLVPILVVVLGQIGPLLVLLSLTQEVLNLLAQTIQVQPMVFWAQQPIVLVSLMIRTWDSVLPLGSGLARIRRRPSRKCLVHFHSTIRVIMVG